MLDKGQEFIQPQPEKKNIRASEKQLYQELFNSLDTNSAGYIHKPHLIETLEANGIHADDTRLENLIHNLQSYSSTDKIYIKDFYKIVHDNIGIVEKCLRGRLIIPSFPEFRRDIEEIFNKTKEDTTGHVADYIPQLKRVDPEQYGVAVTTIHGQHLHLGDANIPFCVQSTCKPINYCIALEDHGADTVHQHVGREPSGTVFNELALNSKGRPHNPMINAGAIMSCSLIHNELPLADRFDYVLEKWTNLCAGKKPGFNNAVYLSEKQTADRNFALGYFMRENNAFPENTNLIEILEFYFQCCSIELTCRDLSMVAATLANAGVCPYTGQRVFSSETVKKCLSLMSSCGMYDFSGEFSFIVGLPAKSGVSGSVMVIVPNVAGFAIWSPRLDKCGNSVRGIEFSKALTSTFNFHIYDNLHCASDKKDPRINKSKLQNDVAVELCWAASYGDIDEIKKLVARGIELNTTDYDKRTALHISAAEGNANVVRYLLLKGVDVNPVDRWGGTPLDDAIRSKNDAVIKLLQKNGALKSTDLKVSA